MKSAIATPDVATAAKLFRGLADGTRLALLLALLDGEQRVTDLVARVGTSQANVSNHLACLKECGLVSVRPEGRQSYYRVANDSIVALLTAAEELIEEAGEAIDLCRRFR